QPGALPDVLGVGAAQPVVPADGPYERGVPLDEGIPRLLVALSGTRYEVGDTRVIAHRSRVLSSSARGQARLLMHSRCLVLHVTPRQDGHSLATPLKCRRWQFADLSTEWFYGKNTMFGPLAGLFGARRCQCRRANKGPATGSPTAPRSIRVTSATEASATDHALRLSCSAGGRMLAAWRGRFARVR